MDDLRGARVRQARPLPSLRSGVPTMGNGVPLDGQRSRLRRVHELEMKGE